MRRRKRRNLPAREPMEYAVAAQKAIAEAESERGRAFLSAAVAGWSMREIAAETGMSASTVCRIITEAERA